MNRTLKLVLPRIWRTRGAAARLLLPLSWIYQAVVHARRQCYRSGWCRVSRFPRPVVVIGGVTVGGSGKTPLTMHVAGLLAAHGYSPGIVSRGYGGRPGRLPLPVTPDTAAAECGDEAAMMARRLRLPIVVDTDRPRGVRRLIEEGCDIVVSDDGLQHYAMDRRVEIAVLGSDGLGNGYCLPAGPLREPPGRLEQVDLIVRNNARVGKNEYAMHLRIEGWTRLDGSLTMPASSFSGRRVHAVAGTGYPAGFFSALEKLGMDIEPHVFPDHHRFTGPDFELLDDKPIVMTEKDAVKCTELPLEDAWYAFAAAELDGRFDENLIELLKP